jgi:hypothetical protein
MKQINLLVLAVIFLFVFLACQTASDASDSQEPQRVPRIVYDVYPNEWYIKQAKLWKKEIDKNPKNPDAWYNYYNAVRYAKFEQTIGTPEKEKKLQKIIEEMGKAIPGTYVYYLLKDWDTHDIGDLSMMRKAYQIDPSRPDTYYYFISHYEIFGIDDSLEMFCKKLYNSMDIAPWLLDYTYNMLMSVEENGILFTNGDNDTYPGWMMQNALGIRKDISIINISLSPIKGYLQRVLSKKGVKVDVAKLKKQAFSENESENKTFSHAKFVQTVSDYIYDHYPDIPIYFAVTVYPDYIDTIKKDLYVVGLAYRYNKERMDNLALIRKNLETRFRLDYLRDNWYQNQFPGATIRRQLHMNYVAPMIMLAEHYKISGELQEAEKWKQLVISLADSTGNHEKVMDSLNKKGL